MDFVTQTLVPLLTLILGYFLNVWVGGIESSREIKRRRIAEKEKAYSEITAKLHELFEEYRRNTLRITTSIAGTPIYGKPDETIVPRKYEEFEALVYKYSLYLKPSIIQRLMDIRLIDYRSYVKQWVSNPSLDKTETIEFLEQHVDEMWEKTKKIISEMRDELGFEKYPDDLIRPWR